MNLRTTIESDLADYVRWNVPGLKAWQYDGPWFSETLDKMIEGREKWLAGERRPPFRHLEIETAGRRHVGWVNVRIRVDDPHMTEAGIDIVEDDAWGRGLGTEAFGLWVDYLFPAFSLTRLGLSTWSGNPGMVRVGEKLGFAHEAKVRNGCEVGGRFFDRIKMGLLRAEWHARQSRP